MEKTANKPLEAGTGKRLDGIQIFRGFAAFTVLLYHINLQFTAFVPGTPDFKADPWPWTIHRLGFLGVDFFFVLSGFIIHHIHRQDLGKPEQGRVFLLKRFFRIQPLLWVIILIKQAYLTFGNKEPIEWMALVNTALAIPGGKMIGVAWTLTFEWMFYLFFLACILSSVRWLWILGTIWAMLVIGMAHIDKELWNPWLQVPLSPYIIQFFCGVLAAEAFSRWPNRPLTANTGIALLVLSLLVAGILAGPFNLTPRQWSNPSEMAFGRYYWGVTFGILVWWTAVNDAGIRRRWLAPLLVIGNASYAIYLFHNEMLQAFIRIGKAAHIFQYGSAVFWMWVFTFILLATCTAIHITIEKPMLGWSRRLIRKNGKPVQLEAAVQETPP